MTTYSQVADASLRVYWNFAPSLKLGADCTQSVQVSFGFACAEVNQISLFNTSKWTPRSSTGDVAAAGLWYQGNVKALIRHSSGILTPYASDETCRSFVQGLDVLAAQ